MGHFRPARLPAPMRAYIDAGNPLPRVWWDFANTTYVQNGQFKPFLFTGFPGVSVARASSAWAFSAGALVEFGDDLPVLTDAGLIVPPAGTNLVPDSEVYTGGDWSFGTSSGTAPSKIADTTIWGVPAATYTVPSGYGYFVVAGLTPGETYTVQWLVRLETATAAVAMVYDHTNNAWIISPTNPAAVITGQLVDGVGYINITFTCPADCTAVRIYPLRNEAYIPGSGGTVSLAAFDLKAGATPSPYIPTAGVPAARAPTVIEFDASVLGLSASQEFEVAYADGSTGTLAASGGVLTLPASDKTYARIAA